jgi:hypothetical protein
MPESYSSLASMAARTTTRLNASCLERIRYTNHKIVRSFLKGLGISQKNSWEQFQGAREAATLPAAGRRALA